MNETKPKIETKTETKPETVPIRIIGTIELSDILTDRFGRTITDKYIRNRFRNDIRFDGIKSVGTYTTYRFNFPSKTVTDIIGRFDEIETERKTKTERSERKRSERKTKTETVIEITDSGFETKTVKPETGRKPETEKTK
jgi:hypothetical protein